MRYFKAYALAFFRISCVFGIIHLVLNAFGGSLAAEYLIYLSVLAAVAGPVGLLIEEVVCAK